jgi:spermidine synthase
VARDTNYFTYLRDTPADTKIVLGDGRLSLAKAPDHYYEMLVLDAFSSDAIPTHLLTLEALTLYRKKLSDTGVLVLHLSNRYLDLEPVVARLIQATGEAGLIRANTDRTPELEASGDPSIWTAIASQPSHLGPLQTNSKWRPLRLRENVALWTDDFSNIFSVFRWSIPAKSRLGINRKAGG